MLTSLFDRVEIHNAITSPIVVDLNSPPDPNTQALLNTLQPSFVLTGPAGRIAWSQAAGIETDIPALTTAQNVATSAVPWALFGVAGFIAWRALRR